MKAQSLVEAAQSGAASPKIDHRFQRHADRAIELINGAMAQIELAKAVADSGFDAAE